MSRKFVNQLRRNLGFQRGWTHIIDAFQPGKERTETSEAAFHHSKILVKDAKRNTEQAVNECKTFTSVDSHIFGEVSRPIMEEAAAMMAAGQLAEDGLDVVVATVQRTEHEDTRSTMIFVGWEDGWKDAWLAEEASRGHTIVKRFCG